jgi:argininosuccinate lyase
MFNSEKFEEINDRLAVIEGNQKLIMRMLQRVIDEIQVEKELLTNIVPNDIMKDVKKDDMLNNAGLYNYRDYRTKHPAVTHSVEREDIV